MAECKASFIPAVCSPANFLELIRSKAGPRPKPIGERQVLVNGEFHNVTVYEPGPATPEPEFYRRPKRGMVGYVGGRDDATWRRW